jgi:hypothetical protein
MQNLNNILGSTSSVPPACFRTQQTKLGAQAKLHNRLVAGAAFGVEPCTMRRARTGGIQYGCRANIILVALPRPSVAALTGRAKA